ncbi:hypothetical protein SNEBB_011048 [Seison nebaliae]|nr:hypothetical protein SNEBB_011048 [Seison nebaliae]
MHYEDTSEHLRSSSTGSSSSASTNFNGNKRRGSDNNPLLSAGEIFDSQLNVNIIRPSVDIEDQSLKSNEKLNYKQIIVCRICGQHINIGYDDNGYVIRCEKCKEATPIRDAPPGKKYARCKCNCLLICRNTSKKVQCPRQNCRRINEVSSPETKGVQQSYHTVLCYHCHVLVTLPTSTKICCPKCKKVSILSEHNTKKKALIFLIFSVILLLIGIGLTIGTYQFVEKEQSLYFIWSGVYLASFVCFICAIIFFLMKRSMIMNRSHVS